MLQIVSIRTDYYPDVPIRPITQEAYSSCAWYRWPHESSPHPGVLPCQVLLLREGTLTTALLSGLAMAGLDPVGDGAWDLEIQTSRSRL